MKKLRQIIFPLLLITLASCSSKFEANSDGLTDLEDAIVDKFSSDAYYTEISITNIPDLGYVTTNVTSTTDPSSMRLEEWNEIKGNWTHTADVSFEINGGKASDFMFQIGDKTSIKQMSELLEKSKEKLKEEKKIDGELSIMTLSLPSRGTAKNIEYFIALKPKNGGTTFSFFYNQNGELLKMDF